MLRPKNDKSRDMIECQNPVIATNDDISFYFPQYHFFSPDGKLSVKSTGYENDWHWTGVKEINPTDADYTFWLWIIQDRKICEMINDEELRALGQEYAKTLIK